MTQIVKDGEYYRYICANGRSFIFDECDLGFFSSHRCTVNERGYVTTNRKTDLVTHLLLEVDNNCIVDHINGNPFDNRRSNLRVVTQSQNHWNYGISSRNTTGYKGIYKDKKINKYHARLCVQGKRIYLGCFKNPTDAAKAYDKAARHYFGEYATLNFPKNGEQPFMRGVERNET